MTDTNRPATPIGHQLIMSINGDVVQMTPDAPNSGGLVVNGSVDSMTYWEWNKTEPYQTELYLESASNYVLLFYLYYTTPTSGRCIGYYYRGGWNDIGEGTFTDQKLN
jgi:hypothetical protein